MAVCPCGSGARLAGCCGPVVYEGEAADTAEALMRARYTAYARRRLPFIIASHDPTTRASVDRVSLQAWLARTRWLALEVLETEHGGPADSRGVVRFRARYREAGEERVHEERSEFRKAHGRWVYVRAL